MLRGMIEHLFATITDVSDNIVASKCPITVETSQGGGRHGLISSYPTLKATVIMPGIYRMRVEDGRTATITFSEIQRDTSSDARSKLTSAAFMVLWDT